MKTLSLTSLNRITKLDFDKSSYANAVGGILSATKLKNIQELKAKNNNLTKVRYSTLNNTKLNSVDLSNNELSTGELDTTLETLDTIGLSNGTLELGGTNALPTFGNYNSAKVRLVNKGWTVGIPGGIDTKFDSAHGYTSTNQEVKHHPDWEGRSAAAPHPKQWVMDGTNNKITCDGRFKNIRTANPIISKVGSLIKWAVEFDFGSNTLTLDQTESETVTLGSGSGTFQINDVVQQTNGSATVTATVELVTTQNNQTIVRTTIPTVTGGTVSGRPKFRPSNGSTIGNIEHQTSGASYAVTSVRDNQELERTAMFSLVDIQTYGTPGANENISNKPNMSIVVKFVAKSGVNTVTAEFKRTGAANVTIGQMDLSSIENKRLRVSSTIDVKESAALTTAKCIFKNVTDNISKTATINLTSGDYEGTVFYNSLAGITTHSDPNHGLKLNIQAGSLDDTNVGTMNVYSAVAKSQWPNRPVYDIDINWDFTNVPVTSYDPDGNENDRPRVKIFRRDFEEIEYLNAGGIYVDPTTGATSTPPWGDRSTGSSNIIIPRQNAAGQTFNVVVCLFISDDMGVTLQPDISKWDRTPVPSRGESKYHLELTHQDVGGNPDTEGYILPNNNFQSGNHDVSITVTPAT